MASERFTHSITVVPEDIDDLGHVSNQVYLRWVLEVAIAHSDSLGWSQREYHDIGGVFVVRRHELDYLAPVYLGQALSAITWIESLRGASCVRATEIVREGSVVLRAATTWVFTSLASTPQEGPASGRRPLRIPDPLRAAFRVPTAR